MLGVLTGFAIIFAVIGVGWILSKKKVIRSDTERLMFNRVAFYAATPALLFTSVSTSDPQTFLSPVTLIVAGATALVSSIFCALFFRRGRAVMASGAGAASYFNSVNIGLPVSMYVVGDATYVVPIVMLQMVVFAPIIIAALSGQPPLKSVGTGLLSPVVVAPLLGLVVAINGWEIPVFISEPIRILGGASIPMILMSFGASLTSSGVLSDPKARPVVIAASALKLIGMPAIGFGLATFFGLGSDLVWACTVLCALPTAQNVYNYAATFQNGQTIARDTVFITTFASLPVMLAIALLFGR
ncbi:MAG: AEC family transporter [Corynebacterium sp.]|nr:AEC family transporter [Corynebacterium sp.]